MSNEYPKWIIPHSDHVHIVGGWHPIVYGGEYKVSACGKIITVLVHDANEEKAYFASPQRFAVIDGNGDPSKRFADLCAAK